MMAASSSRTRSSGTALGRPFSSFSSASAAPSAASALGFQVHHRSASPTRVQLAGTPSASPGRSLAVSSRDHQIAKKPLSAAPPASRRRTCMCSPTTHPGSFRCALHKNVGLRHGGTSTMSSPSSRLNARRSAMANSLVRIGTVEGSDLIKRALAALIRPTSHQQRRRAAFQPRPSRLSSMSKADDDLY